MVLLFLLLQKAQSPDAEEQFSAVQSARLVVIVLEELSLAP